MSDSRVVYIRAVPNEIRRKLKVLAAQQDKTLEQVAREALEFWANRKKT